MESPGSSPRIDGLNPASRRGGALASGSNRKMDKETAMMDQKKTILVTGASGFVGHSVVSFLSGSPQYETRAALRNSSKIFPSPITVIPDCELSLNFDWKSALGKAECVLHCAARVHVMRDSSADPLSEFRRINVEGTLNFARQASQVGVKRFIFLSSLKVNGESTQPGSPFFADDNPNPADPYGISKMEAEQGLRELASKSGMEVVIIRPPLVYGPGVKANFLSLIHWVDRGIPLPLGPVHNKRSLVALDNLVDLIFHCIEHPAAANQTFLVSDDQDLSTTELLKRISRALGKPSRLFPFPAFFLNSAAKMIGKSAITQRLLGSLQADILKTKKLLSWQPPHNVDDALKKTIEFYLTGQR